MLEPVCRRREPHRQPTGDNRAADQGDRRNIGPCSREPVTPVEERGAEQRQRERERRERQRSGCAPPAIAGAREVRCIHRGGKKVGARRRRHIKRGHVRRRAAGFEPQLDRDRRDAAVVPERVGVDVGSRGCRKAERAFRRNRANLPALGGCHRGDIDQAEAEGALREEPRLFALEAIGREIRRAAVPGERLAVRAVRRHREVRGVPLRDCCIGCSEEPARRRHIVLGRCDNGLGIGHAECHQSQGTGHRVEGGADLGLGAATRCLLVRAQDRPLSEEAECEDDQGAAGSGAGGPGKPPPGQRRRGRGAVRKAHEMIVGPRPLVSRLEPVSQPPGGPRPRPPAARV